MLGYPGKLLCYFEGCSEAGETPFCPMGMKSADKNASDRPQCPSGFLPPDTGAATFTPKCPGSQKAPNFRRFVSSP